MAETLCIPTGGAPVCSALPSLQVCLAEYTLVAFRGNAKRLGISQGTEMSGVGSMCNIPAIPAHFTGPARLLVLRVEPFLQLRALCPAPGQSASLL